VGRPVEYDVVATEKVDAGLSAAERKFLATQKKISDGADKSSKVIGDGLGKGIDAAVPGILGNLKGVFSTGGLLGGKALAGGVAAAAPLIGATVSAAIIAGASVGVVGIGVALASKDPRVNAAGKSLGTQLSAGLQAEAGAFVDPLLRQIDKIGDRFETGLRPRIRRIFGDSADFLDPLTDGLLEGSDGLLAGLERLVSKSGPVVDSLGRGFESLGDDIGESLAIIGDGSEDAAKALDLVFDATGEVTKNVALLLRGLTETYGAMDDFGSAVNDTVRGWLQLDDAQQRVTGSGTFAAESTEELATATFLAGLRAQGAAGPIVTLSTEINGLSEASRSAFDAETDLAAALDDATDAARQNGRTLDANTEKGRANRDALSQVANTMRDKYNAEVALNGEGRNSERVARQNRDAFLRLATSMGASRSRAQELANQLGIVASKNPRPTVRLDDGQARAAARRIEAALNAIPRRIETRVFVSRVGEVTYGGGGGRQGSNFNAATYLRAGAGDGVHRTGGAAGVQLTSDVSVYLDGAPFHQMTVRAVQAGNERAAWRQKVGTR
jgi:hypothetical protein